jgi:O-antigen ligase
MEVSKQHILTGVGTGDSEQVLVETYQENGFQKGVDERYNAHSQYLQVLVDAGIFSLLLMLAVFYFSLRRAIHHTNTLYLCFLLLFLINILTESMLKTQSGVVFYAFFNTLLGLHFSDKPQHVTKY